jgi:hypothetical protein
MRSRVGTNRNPVPIRERACPVPLARSGVGAVP